MPGIRTRESLPSTSSRNRRHAVDSSEDEDEETGILGATIISSDEEEENSDEEDLQSDISEDEAVPNAQQRSNDTTSIPTNDNAYKTGAIRSIYMKNFVTYSEATFECGPSLNMIIGPNGTGKSTLVCAIAIGLGWPPAVLGRSRDVSDYIKNGTQEAIIQIEMEGPNGRTISVRRNIMKDAKKGTGTSKWRLNGKECTHKTIKEKMADLNIQVDNLCQFLPQDRVVEFSGMSPVQLMEQTEKAAAGPEMWESHQQLVELGAKAKKLQDDKKAQAAELGVLNSRQARSQEEVDKMLERRVHEAKAENLDKAFPFFEYCDAKQRYEAAKEEFQQAEVEEKKLKDELGPALQQIESKKVYANGLKSEVDQAKQRIRDSQTQVQGVSRIVIATKSKIEACNTSIEAELKQQKKRREDIVRSKTQIANLERRSKEPPPAFDGVAMNQQIRDLEAQMERMKSEQLEFREQLKEKLNVVSMKRQQKERMEKERDALKTQSGQLMQKLAQMSRDSARAYQWLQEHEDLFKGKVYGPPLITCSVKNPALVDAVESAIGQGDFLTFTVTNRDDFQTLQHHLLSQGNECLNLTDIHIKQASRPLSSLQRPSDEATLRGLGFGGWLLDLVEGPEPVLMMLAESNLLHKTAFATRNQSEAEFQQVQSSAIQRWATKDTLYVTTIRREYNHTSTQTTPLRKARFWVDQPVDTSHQSALNRSILELQHDIETIKSEGVAMQDEKLQLEKKLQTVTEERNDQKAEKEKLQSLRSQFENIINLITTEKAKLDNYQKSQQAVADRINTIKREKELYALEKVTKALLLPRLLRTIKQRVQECIDAQLRSIEAQSDLTAFEAQNLTITQRIKVLEEATARCKAEQVRNKEISRKLAHQATNIAKTMAEEETAVIYQYVDRRNGNRLIVALNTIRTEIESLRTRADMLGGGNSRVIEQYEKRKLDIAATETKIADLADQIGKIEAEIKEIRDIWEPSLVEIVGRISKAFTHNFERIGCVGEVLVGGRDGDDYSQWCINIMISFREGEDMSLLDSHRQSGGERAVSTVFYLMALQSLARSPFRVVDEINQGMDPRNERMVHGRMVDIACEENTSQYFLVTPKLLSNLEYHRRMKVHIIYSGNSMPAVGENTIKLDLPSLANLALHVRGRA